MKELKFRVWFENVKRGRVIDGEIVWKTESYYDYDPVIDNNGLLDVEAGWDIQGHSDEKYIIEQYTGLKDKNGKEIYEGDIVTLNGEWEEIEDTDCSVITFENGCFRVGDGCENEAGSYLSDWRVIGNVHQNADLLEKK